MTDQQIQDNADRAHADSVAMTAAIEAQTAQMKATADLIASQIEVQKQLDASIAGLPGVSEATLLEIVKALAPHGA